MGSDDTGRHSDDLNALSSGGIDSKLSTSNHARPADQSGQYLVDARVDTDSEGDPDE